MNDNKGDLLPRVYSLHRQPGSLLFQTELNFHFSYTISLSNERIVSSFTPRYCHVILPLTVFGKNTNVLTFETVISQSFLTLSTQITYLQIGDKLKGKT